MFGIPRRELKKFLESALSEKERQIILGIQKLRGKSIFRIVKNLSNDCAPSTVKYAIKKFSRIGIVFEVSDFGKKAIFLTEAGHAFCDLIGGEKNENR